MNTKNTNSEKWRHIGNNVPTVEVFGPHANQYRLFVEDIDGDLIGLLPVEAKRLIERLQTGLNIITERRNLRTAEIAQRK